LEDQANQLADALGIETEELVAIVGVVLLLVVFKCGCGDSKVAPAAVAAPAANTTKPPVVVVQQQQRQMVRQQPQQMMQQQPMMMQQQPMMMQQQPSKRAANKCVHARVAVPT